MNLINLINTFYHTCYSKIYEVDNLLKLIKLSIKKKATILLVGFVTFSRKKTQALELFKYLVV